MQWKQHTLAKNMELKHDQRMNILIKVGQLVSIFVKQVGDFKSTHGTTDSMLGVEIVAMAEICCVIFG